MVQRITSRCQPQTRRLRHIAKKCKTCLIRTITIKACPGKNPARRKLTDLGELGLIIQRRMRWRHDQQCRAGRQAGKIGKMHDGSGLAAPQIGFAQQHRKRLITATIKRMNDDVRPINQPQPRTNNKPNIMIARRTMRPDNAGK